MYVKKYDTYFSTVFEMAEITRSRVFSFQISSGCSCVDSNICTEIAGDSIIASKNTAGKNLLTLIRTFGPVNLSAVILPKISAHCSRICGFREFVNRSKRYMIAPAKQVLANRNFMWKCLMMVVIHSGGNRH